MTKEAVRRNSRKKINLRGVGVDEESDDIIENVVVRDKKPKSADLKFLKDSLSKNSLFSTLTSRELLEIEFYLGKLFV